MGSLLDVLNPIAKVTDIAGGWGNMISQAENRRQQLELQKESWSREDNAIQRRVADLKAAGLSPILAAGSAASSSSPIQVTAPQAPTDNFDKLNMASAMIQQKADIARSSADTHLTEANAKNMDRINLINAAQDKLQSDIPGAHTGIMGIARSNQEVMDANRERAQYERDRAQAEAAMAESNRLWFERHGVPSNMDASSLNTLFTADKLKISPGTNIIAGALLDAVKGVGKTYAESKIPMRRLPK